MLGVNVDTSTLNLCGKVLATKMNIYSIPTLRERICRIRFFILKRTFALKQGTTEGVLHISYSKSHFNAYHSFKDRVSYLVNTLNSLLTEPILNKTVLSIGPRFESEIFGYRSLGFKWKNIQALDTFSYSPKITIGNMHSTAFKGSSFDFVVCGWTIAYSATPLVALNEMARVLKPGGKLILTWDLPQNYDAYDPSSLTLNRKSNIDKSETRLPEKPVLELIDSIFKVYRFEVGKLTFNGDTPFATLVLESIKDF